jgi:hypothetical protein
LLEPEIVCYLVNHALTVARHYPPQAAMAAFLALRMPMAWAPTAQRAQRRGAQH